MLSETSAEDSLAVGGDGVCAPPPNYEKERSAITRLISIAVDGADGLLVILVQWRVAQHTV